MGRGHRNDGRGGIYISGGNVSFVNSVFDNLYVNELCPTYRGSVMYIADGADVSITNSEITNNKINGYTTQYGGSIYLNGGSLSIQGSNFNYNGKLTYADFYIKGKVKQEIFFSSYICHPQMVNDQLSGPAVLTGIAEKLMNKKNYYSYRFVLAPETIGSIAYLSKNLDILKKNVIGGYNIACVGDEKNWGLINSRYGNNISEKIAEHVLKYNTSNFIKYSWLDRGSDERQYCAPGVELPISSITRSKYDEYPEYHTSLDNFNLVTKKGLTESLNIYLKCIKIFELNNIAPKINVLCEPQLSKRNLYPTISGTHSKKTENLMNFISYCDGKNSLLEISNLCKIEFFECLGYYKKIKIENLFSKED